MATAPPPAGPAREETGRTSVAGRWCVVTGAAKGIGRAIAESLAREGACLMLSALHPDKLDEVAASCKELGAKEVDFIEGDLAQNEFVEELAKRALAHGPTFVLVNNAGRHPTLVKETPMEGDPDEWETNVRINLLAPMRLTRRLAPSMVEQGHGHIINIASLNAVRPESVKCAYSASKWGLRGWSKSCYGALRDKNVKVTCIHPGTVLTDMTANQTEQGAKAEKMISDTDIAEGVLAALRMGPNAVIEEMVITNNEFVNPGGVPT